MQYRTDLQEIYRFVLLSGGTMARNIAPSANRNRNRGLSRISEYDDARNVISDGVPTQRPNLINMA